jgi:plastocyanin domain-containing protein
MKVRTFLLLSAIAIVACEKKPAAGALPPGAVAVTADDHGFSPSSVSFKKGAPASLVFTRTTDDTCAKEVVIPDLKITKELPKNQPVAIEIPTDTAKTLTFQCGMGMYKSSIVVN